MKVVRTISKAFNVDLLLQELVSLGITGFAYPGFYKDSQDTITPNASIVQYGEISVGNQTQVLQANPGELHFEVDSDPGVSLDNALTAHDHTVKTQVQQDRDADLVALAAAQAEMATGVQPSSETLITLSKLLGRI